MSLMTNIFFYIFQTDKTNETVRKKLYRYRSENWYLSVCIGSSYGKTDSYQFSDKFGKNHTDQIAHTPSLMGKT